MRMKKWIAFLMAGMLVASVCGCKGGNGNSKGGSSADNGGKKVEIKYLNTGLGVEWLEAAIDAFNKSQSDWSVYYTAASDATSVSAAYGEEDVDTVDLYYTTILNDSEYMEPLDDLLASTAEGDSEPLQDKMKPEILKRMTDVDGHYYFLPIYEPVTTIVYNKVLFDKAGITQLPRTTDELISVGEVLLDEGITPWIHFKNGGYYDVLRYVWHSQYDGVDYFYDTFRKLTDNYGGLTAKDILLKKDGRYETLKVFEQIITPDTVVPGSNSNDHITSQTMFLNQEIGMMVNGSWLSNEMNNNDKIEDFEMMKTPVISSITDKLTTVESDTTLRKLVSAIDAVTSGEADISDYQSGSDFLVDGDVISMGDWEYVASARNSLYSGVLNQGFFIPKYSDAKEGAEAFLRFFYSDEWKMEHFDILHSAHILELDVENYDFSEWNAFEVSTYELTTEKEHNISRVIGMNTHPLFKDTWTDEYANYVFIPDFCSVNSADRRTAEQVWETITETLEQKYKNYTEYSEEGR